MRINAVSKAVLALAVSLPFAACGPLNDPRGPHAAMESAQVFSDGYAEQAMTYLARADYPNAERYALGALRGNPKDPYALYVAGMVYQASGRYDLARQYYEVILANRPQVTLTVLADGAPQVRTLTDIAMANMAVVDKITGRNQPRSAFQAGRMPEPGPSTEPMMPALTPRSAVSAQPLDATMGAQGMGQAETNVAGRFRLLKRLMEEGLITPDEYGARRDVNAGALTPYSARKMPALGLQRPGPGDSQVVDRLKELAKSLEMRAISPGEHAAERSAILDALMPAEPRKLELPALPPKDVMEAASAVGRVERLRAAGLVSTEEAKREKDTIERLLDSQLSKIPVSGTSTGLRHGSANGGKSSSSSGTGQPGVSLGSAKTEEAAQATWDRIKAKFPEELGAMNATMRKVENDKGTRWKIMVGPMKSRDEAVKLCKVLKLHRQACDATGF